MNLTLSEIESQPAVWEQALALDDRPRELLRQDGARMLILGCGTSAYVAQSIARLRERAGLGLTDHGFASEPISPRSYDVVVAITRSGTTTEVLEALRSLPPQVRRVVITAERDTPAGRLADDAVVLDFADEESVVQTRFPTAQLILARHAFGESVADLPDRLREALGAAEPAVTAGVRHIVFLGTDWTLGLAQEAALKVRESAQAWVEAYPMLDFRHGPIAVASAETIAWMIGCADAELESDIRQTGAAVVPTASDGLIDLVLAQRAAVELAFERGLDPDSPRNLTRSIILPGR